MLRNAPALILAGLAVKVVGRFVPRSARCILIAPAATVGAFFCARKIAQTPSREQTRTQTAHGLRHFFALPRNFDGRKVESPLENRRALWPPVIGAYPDRGFFLRACRREEASGRSRRRSCGATTKSVYDGSPNEEFGFAPARARPVMERIIGPRAQSVISTTRKNPLRKLSRCRSAA